MQAEISERARLREFHPDSEDGTDEEAVSVEASTRCIDWRYLMRQENVTGWEDDWQ